MRKPVFRGSGVAVVTPFDQHGVDLNAFGRLLDWQMESGTDAVIVCGTTGESSAMTAEERLRTIAFCVERVNGRIPVIAGTGSNATANAVRLSRDAEAAGADAVLLVTPYYNKASQSGLILHYRAIADAVSCPCILYNVPSRTGVNLLPATCAELAKHPNIAGIKEASGNLGAVQEIRRICPEDFSVWSGNDGDVAAVCAYGGMGVISVLANVIPAEMHTLTDLCFRNDYAAAGKMQIQWKDLCDALFCEVNPIPVKTALNLMGRNAGELRLPLCPPSAEHRERIRSVLKAHALME